ncbi:MAG: PQQ-binding-like beta-propeller repeat protein, partial [Theionarchaea archaeon]|nr:PQQ-binding-like beta-propeller repeat protein [Theionarchaea archaeon]
MKSNIRIGGLLAFVFLVLTSASEGFGEFQVTYDDEWQYDPAIYKNIVVWTDHRNAVLSHNVDIYGYDLVTKREFRITENGNAQYNPAIYEDIVVWEDDRNDSGDEFHNSDIYGYNLSTQKEIQITDDLNVQISPEISGDIVVWVDLRNGNYDIYGYNLLTQEEFQITEDSNDQDSPALYGDIVVWRDNRNGNLDIYGYNLLTQEEFQITDEVHNQSSPAIYGDIVVWTDSRNGTMDIYGANLLTQEEFHVFTGPGDQYGPDIYENIVVWTDNTDDFWDIYGYNLSEREGFHILTGPGNRESPKIFRDTIVWQDHRNSTRDIYGCTLLTIDMDSTCNWSHTYGNGARTSYCDTDIVPPFDFLWKSTVQHGAITGAPVVSGDYLVLVETLGTLTYDGSLICYRMTGTGLENVWSRPLSWVDLGVSPVIAGNKVIYHSLGKLLCFDLETGHMLWEAEYEFTPISPGIINAGMAVATTDDGCLSVIDISTGDIISTQKSLNGVPCHFFQMVTVGDGNIFCCFTTAEEEGVAAFNVQGELLWKRTGDVRYRAVDHSVHVILYTEGILFVVFSDNTLQALDGESGDVLWSYQGKHLLDDLSSDGKHFYVYDKADEGVVCLDVYSGEVLWKSPSLFAGDRDLRIDFYKSLVSSQDCVFICRHTLWDMDTPRIFALDR